MADFELDHHFIADNPLISFGDEIYGRTATGSHFTIYEERCVIRVGSATAKQGSLGEAVDPLLEWFKKEGYT